MNSPTKRFCIDIDNVIAQTDEIMRRVIRDFTEGRVRLEYGNIVKFNYYECSDSGGNQITKEEWKHVHNLFSEGQYLMRIQPMSGAIDGLRQLAEYGMLHLATSRIRKARKATIEWLDVNEFPDHDLHFLRQGEKHASLRPFAAAVEDQYEQAEAFAVRGETPCFLIRHPWNQNGARVENVTWVRNWDELTGKLLELVP